MFIGQGRRPPVVAATRPRAKVAVFSAFSCGLLYRKRAVSSTSAAPSGGTILRSRPT